MHGFFQKLLSWVYPGEWLRAAVWANVRCCPGFALNVKFENDDEKICRDAWSVLINFSRSVRGWSL